MFYTRQFVYLTLVLGVACNGLYLNIDGLPFTPGRLSALFFVVNLLLLIAYFGRFRYGGPAGIALAGWLLWSLLVNLLVANRFEHLVHWASIAAATMWFWWIVGVRPAWEKIERAVAVALIILGSSALFAYLARTAWPHSHFLDVLVPATHGLPRVKLWMHEPNIFGAVMAAGTCLIFGQRAQGSVQIRLALLLGLIGVLLSFSKGPWLDLAAGYAAYIVFVGSKKHIALVGGCCLATVIVIAAISLYELSSGSFSFHWLASLMRGHNIWVREEIIRYAWKGIVASPLIGNGTFSFSGSWPTLAKMIGLSNVNNLWIWNGAVLVLHDTGAVGLILIGYVWLGILFRGISKINKTKKLYGRVKALERGAAVMAACVAVLVQDQSTTVISLSLYWAVFGIGAMVPFWLASEMQHQKESVSGAYSNVSDPPNQSFTGGQVYG